MQLQVNAVQELLLFDLKANHIYWRLPQGDLLVSRAEYIRPMKETPDYCEYKIAQGRRLVIQNMNEDIVALTTYAKEQEVYIEFNKQTQEVDVC